MCKVQLKSDCYAPFRSALYSYAANKLSRRQLIALCDVCSYIEVLLPFSHPYFSKYACLFSHLHVGLSSPSLLLCCLPLQILITAMDVEKPQKSLREVQYNVEEEEDATAMQMRQEREAAIMVKLSSPCLVELRQALDEGRFKRDVWERISAEFSQIALFRFVLALYQCTVPWLLV